MKRRKKESILGWISRWFKRKILYPKGKVINFLSTT